MVGNFCTFSKDTVGCTLIYKKLPWSAKNTIGFCGIADSIRVFQMLLHVLPIKEVSHQILFPFALLRLTHFICYWNLVTSFRFKMFCSCRNIPFGFHIKLYPQYIKTGEGIFKFKNLFNNSRTEIFEIKYNRLFLIL